MTFEMLCLLQIASKSSLKLPMDVYIEKGPEEEVSMLVPFSNYNADVIFLAFGSNYEAETGISKVRWSTIIKISSEDESGSRDKPAHVDGQLDKRTKARADRGLSWQTAGIPVV